MCEHMNTPLKDIEIWVKKLEISEVYLEPFKKIWTKGIVETTFEYRSFVGI